MNFLSRIITQAILFDKQNIQHMKIVLIGSGNVATVLGSLFCKQGHNILQVISRDLSHANTLAARLKASAAGFNIMPHKDADIILVALTDDALYNGCQHFDMQDKLVLHTAGSASIKMLQKFSSRYGVLYPLQSLKKDVLPAANIPLLVDGNTEESTKKIFELAYSISGNVTQVTDEKRLVLHTAAVIVNNFSNQLYTLAEDLCKKENADFNLLKPLILETAMSVQDHSPAAMQTGPAMRKDIHTMDKHLRLLLPYPKLRTMYLRLTESIMNP